VKILSVVGARPQFIKAAVVSRALAEQSGVTEVLVHTGQHYDPDMSEVFFEELDVPRPDRSLGVGSGTHAVQTARMLERLEEALLEEAPDAVLVYGDTNSTLAGALAAAKLHLPVAHVEAGLRSFNRAMPEEVNRVLTDHVSELLLAPTDTAVRNLLAEGIESRWIERVGDVMYDAALHYAGRAADSPVLERLGLEEGGYILATVHRAENTDVPARLEVLVEALCRVGERVPVVLPLHPRTRGALERLGLLEAVSPGMRLVDPVGYLDMIRLEQASALIATDSGGVQKEAFFHGVPCVTLRDETEWVELVELGWNRLAPPTGIDRVVSALEEALGSRGRPGEPYGDGRAGTAVVRALEEHFGRT
jgi:UDP-GlcNAc3NAcA epimerase